MTKKIKIMSKKKVKVIVLRTAGTNCDAAMKFSII